MKRWIKKRRTKVSSNLEERTQVEFKEFTDEEWSNLSFDDQLTHIPKVMELAHQFMGKQLEQSIVYYTRVIDFLVALEEAEKLEEDIIEIEEIQRSSDKLDESNIIIIHEEKKKPIAPNLPKLYFMYSCRSEAHFKMEDYIKSLEDAEKAIEVNPKFVTAYMRKGLAFEQLSRFSDAIKTYESGLLLVPNHSTLFKLHQNLYFRVKSNNIQNTPNLIVQLNSSNSLSSLSSSLSSCNIIEQTDINRIKEKKEEQYQTEIIYCQQIEEESYEKKWEWQTVHTTITSGHEFPTPRHAYSSALFPRSGVLYMFGGYTGKSLRLGDFYQFHLPSRTWRKIHSHSQKGSPGLRHSATMVAVEERNELYLFGGSGESGAMNDLFVFNILRQSWRQINVSGDQPCPRWSHECVYSPLDQKIYLFAGFGNLRLNDLWSFDLQTEKWEQIEVEDAPSDRHFHSLTIKGNKIYLYGGFDGNRTLSDLHCFDIEEKKWKVIAEECVTRRSHSAVIYGGNLYIYGGRQKDNNCSDTFSIRLDNGEVTKINSSGTAGPRNFHRAEVWGGCMWIFCGLGTNGNCSDVWKFWLVEPTFKKSLHHSEVSFDLSLLLKDSLNPFVDVIFVLENNVEVFAHKVILSARSEHFRALFSSGMAESNFGTKIELTHVSERSFRQLLQWVYSGKVDIEDYNELVDLLVLSDEFLFNDLKMNCSYLLRTFVRADTVNDLSIIAELHNSPLLLSFCEQFNQYHLQ